MRLRKILSMFLVIVMLFGMTANVYASDEVLSSQSFSVNNPLYEYFDSNDSVEAPILYAAPENAPAYADYPTSLDVVISQLRQGMIARERSITVYYALSDYLTKADVVDMFDAAMTVTDDPAGGDYLKWSWHEYATSFGGSVISGVKYYYITYTIDYYTTAAEEDYVADKIDELLESFAFDESHTAYYKIKTIYDYICSTVTYDYDGYSVLSDGDKSNDDYSCVTAYKALSQGTAVCQGYATLFYRMAMTVGLDARLIAGTSRSQGHAWNIVQIGDYYYNLDSTWDAGRAEYDYFLRSDASFASGHSRYPDYATESFYDVYPMGGDYVTTLCDENGHGFTMSVVEPSCQEKGHTAYVCGACGESYAEEETPALGHSFTNYVSDENATCTEDRTLTAMCDRCDETDTIAEVGSKLGHDWETDYTVDKVSTCTENGEKSIHCSRCSERTKITSIPASHEWKTDYTVDKTATCESAGQKSIHCKNCTEVTKVTVLPALGHNWNDGEVTKEASVLKAGVLTYTCLTCGKTKTEMIPILAACDGTGDCVTKQFADVRNDWTHKGIDYAIENGLFAGTSDTTFEPDTIMTRAMLVTVLHRYDGKELVGENSFTDVEDSWYTAGVAWAAHKGVVYGVDDGVFAPNDPVSREQLAAILYRYANLNGVDVSAQADLSVYPDGGSVSPWAQKSVSWAVAEGLISGTTSGDAVVLSPQGGATRAMVAAIMMRFVEYVMEP